MGVGKLDLEALKGYKPGGGGMSIWWKPDAPDGGEQRHRFRMLPPYREDMQVPFLDARLHYGTVIDDAGERKRDGGVCPRFASEDGKAVCRQCDIYWATWNAPELKGDENKALRNAVQKLAPKTRLYANVVPRGLDRVMIWSLPYGLHLDIKNQLMTYLEDGIDLTDPENGRDLVLTVTRSGGNKRYPSVAVTPIATPVGIEDWQDHLLDLHEQAFSRILTSEEAEAMIEPTLGELLPAVIALYEQRVAAAKERKAEVVEHPSAAAAEAPGDAESTTSPDEEDLGEEVA